MRFVQIQQAPDGAHIIGIEITDPALAGRCAINIDGQHGMPCTPEAWRGRAAIDLAAEVELPPADATIAFLRPDLDAVGAAALLVLRRVGIEPDDRGGHPRRDYVRAFADHGGALVGDLAARARLVAERDSFRPGGPWAPSPLPTEADPWPRGMAAVSETRELAAVASVCSPRRGDADLQLAERVLVAACWLLWSEPGAEGETWGAHGARGVLRDLEQALVARADAAAVLRDARRRVDGSRLDLVRAVHEPGALEMREDGGRRVAVVRVAHAGALGVGYCLAPVVVAVDAGAPGKFTVASWAPDAFDHGAFRSAVNAAEGRAEIAWLSHIGRDELDAWVRERVASGRRMYADNPDAFQQVERDASVARHHRPGDPRAASAIAGLVHYCSPQWGGGAAITGSPQVPGGTRLTERQVIDAAMEACR